MSKKNLKVFDILIYGNPVLARKAEEITNITSEIKELAEKMVFTMHSTPGIGLAAPQVNHSVQLITIDLSVGEKPQELFILINPEIINQDGELLMEEGCLSVPEINEKITRPERVTVRAGDLNGNEKIFEAEGLLARVFCHEIDHINGKLFIDKLSSLKRNIIKQKFKKRIAAGDTG